MLDGDGYYIGDRSSGRLPVYRVIANDAEDTRYYIDPVSGALLERADANRRWHRWLFGAIHRLDFAAWIRVRPVWDIILIVLMLGGIAVSATGVYLALRRVRNDLERLFWFVARAAQRIARLWQGDGSSRETQPIRTAEWGHGQAPVRRPSAVVLATGTAALITDQRLCAGVVSSRKAPH
jgi:hypothetical protein